MPPARNPLPLAGFAICLIALFSYPFFFAGFPITRDVPWVNWLLFAGGLALCGAGVRRAFRGPTRRGGRVVAPLLGVAGLAAVVLFVFMTEIWSRDLPPAANAPRPGEPAPDFTLTDATGRPARLHELLATPLDGSREGARGAWALLIFYRGSW